MRCTNMNWDERQTHEASMSSPKFDLWFAVPCCGVLCQAAAQLSCGQWWAAVHPMQGQHSCSSEPCRWGLSSRSPGLHERVPRLHTARWLPPAALPCSSKLSCRLCVSK